jgi:hypothetical protein
VDNNDLQNTLYLLAQSGSLSNPAYNLLWQDYTRYHTVLLIEGGLFALLLLILSTSLWRRFKRLRKVETGSWTFEEKTYFCLGLITAVVALFMLLIVVANLSNVVNPRDGFVQSIPVLGKPQAGTLKAALYQAVNTWAQSGETQMPFLLQDEVRKRLSWQQPKAIICSFLLVVLAIFTARIWQKLIRNSRASEPIWSLKEKMLLVMGIMTVPVTFLLMIMVLANTQALFAPIFLTLLFS